MSRSDDLTITEAAKALGVESRNHKRLESQ